MGIVFSKLGGGRALYAHYITVTGLPTSNSDPVTLYKRIRGVVYSNDPTPITKQTLTVQQLASFKVEFKYNDGIKYNIRAYLDVSSTTGNVEYRQYHCNIEDGVTGGYQTTIALSSLTVDDTVEQVS